MDRDAPAHPAKGDWRVGFINDTLHTNAKKKMGDAIVGRFAPSPSGRMHLGNIFAALMSYGSAKSRGGKWLLRIEDLDRQRCRPEYSAQIVDDLAWMGLVADEGAGAATDGGHGPYYQSERDGIYAEEFRKLQTSGLAYECFCRRQDLTAASAPHASDGHTIYARTCLTLSEAEKEELRKKRKPAWRMLLPDEESTVVDGHYGAQRANLAKDRGDFILRRADGNYAYQLAVVVDDALMGVNEVVRARDLLSASHEQSYLLRELGYATPSYCHFPLLVAPDGSRLSKRERSLAMDKIRERLRPVELVGLMGWWAGFQTSWRPMSVGEFVEAFDWGKVPTEDIVVDPGEVV